MSWRHLEGVIRLRLQKTSSRRLNKDVYFPISHTSSEDGFKTCSRCLDQDEYIRLGDTSSRRLANTSWRGHQDVLQKRLQDIFKTSSRRLRKVSSRHLEDVFKTYHQVKLLLLTRLQDISETYSASFWDVLPRRLSTERFEIFWSVYKIFQNELFGKSFKTKYLMC